jgi:hypothetical protein
MTEDREEVAVTQADREIGVQVLKMRRGWSDRAVKAMIGGGFDGHDAVRGAALARLAAEQATAARVAELLERVRELEAAGAEMVGWIDEQSSPDDRRARPASIDKAMRPFRRAVLKGTANG